VDLSAVTFIDSAGVGFLAGWCAPAPKRDGG
jgi:anti-anti-sigma regulatory factor